MGNSLYTGGRCVGKVTDISDSTVPLTSVAQALEAETRLGNFLRAVEIAQDMHAALPKRTREVLNDCAEHSPELDDSVVHRMALDMSKFPRRTLDVMHDDLLTVRNFISFSGGSDSPCTVDAIDMRVIEGLLLFIQKLGTKSVRQLCQFLEGANEGDRGYLMIASQGRDSEIRMRHNAPQGTREYFDLE